MMSVGTDDYIKQHMRGLVDEYTSDIEALKYLNKQQQWALLRKRINTRPHYLVRSMPRHQGKEALVEFDKHMTTKILDIIDVKSIDTIYDHVNALRSLKNSLGGGMTPQVAANHFRVKQKR